jgi:formamidopyrimidine-DNA glycosylase
MTGKLLTDPPPSPFLRALLELDDRRLAFDDVRQFGRMLWSASSLPAGVARLGPEPLETAPEEFVRSLRSRRGRVKALLMNQAFLGGMGNIYTDEALHRAGIHPEAEASKLSKPRCLRLHAAIVAVLTEAIASRGSSISDYVDTDGRGGEFQQRHRVYGRESEPCLTCAKAAIRRIVVAQRGTHFCPRCQRR